MGTVSLKTGDGTARFRRSTLCSSAVNLIMLASVLTTNLFALYAFTTPPSPFHHPHHSALSPALFHHHQHRHNKTLSAVADHVSLILREIASSERKLHQIERDLAGYESLDATSPRLSAEAKLFLSRHPLPLGRDARSGITHLVSSISHSCSPDSISRYTSYAPYSPCPSGELHYQLLSKGCEPLPRRRCLTRRPKPSLLLLPFPRSLWPPAAKGLNRQMWVSARGKNDFLIDEVLALGSGGVRVGFDIGGGVGDFAARMAERNVTVVTSNSGIEVDVVAARGLIPLLLTPAARFPFQDSVFDLVHIGRGLDEGGVQGEGRVRPEALEFLMFDIDRVMRAGGLLWLDNYVCVDDERKRTVTRLVERFKYKKLKWVVGEKAAAATGGGKMQVYLSAVLQKPARG